MGKNYLVTHTLYFHHQLLIFPPLGQTSLLVKIWWFSAYCGQNEQVSCNTHLRLVFQSPVWRPRALLSKRARGIHLI